MYAVVRTGGKQYKVAKDDVILVEKLDGEAGASIDLVDILMIGDEAGATVGTPVIDGASVSATVVEQGRGDKILVFKKKRRKGYRRTKGHRQDLTVLRITDINASGTKKKAAKKTAKADDAEKAPAKAEKVDKAPEKADKKAEAKPAKKAPAKKPAAKKEAKSDADKKAPAKKKPAAKKKADGETKE